MWVVYTNGNAILEHKKQQWSLSVHKRYNQMNNGIGAQILDSSSSKSTKWYNAVWHQREQDNIW